MNVPASSAPASNWRWVALMICTLASSLSYLDRNILAALAPEIRTEFGLSGSQYGMLVSVFSFSYALSAPFAGAFVDRVGLNRGLTSAVAMWSLAGLVTSATSGFAGLLACRTWLGIAESPTIPANGKASAVYMQPGERAIGSAVGQMGITVGAVIAPLLAAYISPRFGWRSAFLISGVLGLAWIPLWLLTSRAIPPSISAKSAVPTESPWAIWRERKLWGLVVANMLAMTIYSLWHNWTTPFLVRTFQMPQNEANLKLAWIPHVFAAAGGLLGGSISLRMIRAGRGVVESRLRAALIAGFGVLIATGVAPLAPNATIATIAIGFSFFWVVAQSVNVYSLPLDYFGASRAASGVAALTFGFGMIQTLISPAIGFVEDRWGFGPVCGTMAFLPLVSWVILRATAPSK